MSKNIALSSTEITPNYLPFHTVIVKSGQTLELDHPTFKSRCLEPLREALSPWMDCDLANFNFEDPANLASLDCYNAFLESCKLMLKEQHMPTPEGPMGPDNMKFAMLFAPFLAQEAVQASSPKVYDMFAEWNEESGQISEGEMPREVAFPLMVFCALMDAEVVGMTETKLSSDMELSFFRFSVHQSLGNLEGAKRMASRSLARLHLWNNELELVPLFKVVYPALNIGVFFFRNGMLEMGLQALDLAQQHADRYSQAALAVGIMEGVMRRYCGGGQETLSRRKRLLSADEEGILSDEGTSLSFGSDPSSDSSPTLSLHSTPRSSSPGDVIAQSMEYPELQQGGYLMGEQDEEKPFWEMPNHNFDLSFALDFPG